MDSKPEESDVREPFLNSASSLEGYRWGMSNQDHDNITTRGRNIRLTWLSLILLITYLPLGLAFLWLYIQLVHQQQLPPCTIPDLLPSPARESGIMSYQARTLDVSIVNNPFSGPPTALSDHAWHELIEHNIIVISKAEAERAKVNTLELADGSGHAVIPAVGHQLHCLKRIRHWIYRDHYHANDTAHELEENEAHVNHCVEALRQQIMCNGDQEFSSLYYLNDSDPQSFTSQDFSLHQCVDWSKLRRWMVDRSVRVTTPGLFKFPYHVSVP